METVITSDIHANLVAVKAVDAYLRARGTKHRLWCLGDVVGYGPRPRECLEWAAKCEVLLQGNHDAAVVNDQLLARFDPAAQAAIRYTREQFAEGGLLEFGMSGESFLDCLAPSRWVRDAVLAHASPAEPLMTYLFPPQHPKRAGYWSMDRLNLEAAFDEVQRIGIVGHTHIGGVFLQDSSGNVSFTAAESIPEDYPIPSDKKAIINVGSVGQPRDNDPRACFVTMNEALTRVTFHRVPYSVDEVVAEMKGIPLLVASASRLEVGN